MSLRLAKYVVVIAVLFILLADDSAAWWRRRRRRCDRNCVWRGWSSWSSCSASCGSSGTKTRTRSHAVTRQCNGRACTGPSRETVACNRRCCPRNCRWHSWSSWSSCTATCGSSGTRSRTRTVAVTPYCGGSSCTGDSSQTSPCNRHCPHGAPDGPRCNCADTGYSGTCCDNDIDECARGTHHCHQHSNCTNTEGSYRCVCNNGYTGNGRTCTALCWGSTTCPHGGICSSPDQCTSCDSGYESPDCGKRDAPDLVSCPDDTPITVNSPDGGLLDWTDPEFRFQPSNELADHECSANKGDAAPIGTHNVQCWAEGYADGTTCDFDVIIQGAFRPGRARQKNELYYYSGSCAFNEDDIKRNLIQLYATLGDCSAGIRCGISDIGVTCGLTSRKRRDTPRDAELREDNVDTVVKRSTLGHTIKITFFTEAESLAEEPTANDQSEVIGALDNIYFELRARVAARTFNLEIGGQSLEAVNYVGLLPAFDLQCEGGQIEKVETFGAVCINCPVGTYEQDNTCHPCPPGWYQDEEGQTECKVCPSQDSPIEGCGEEPDHCYLNPCQNGGTCHDYVGFYNCTCPDSFTGADCEEDVDECDQGTDTCDDAATCANVVGSYNCTCDDGYIGEGYSCIDVDECALGTDTCDEHATCTNTPGSFTCTCNSGYNGDGSTCSDINECQERTDTCDEHATCTNTPGSYTCTCNPGYNGDGNTCTDSDPCQDGPDTCDEHATCTNTPGSYTCDCNPGYTGDGFTCTDNDECTLGTDTCHAAATCNNTPGSFTCACNVGYTGDGYTCTDNDECILGTDTCHAAATCTNTPGSFTCACNGGYTGDGNTCTDIDECDEGTDTCDEQATCTNTPGSYTCACNPGYNGDGYTCTGSCSPGFEFWNGACYYYSESKRTFLSAESDCDGRGATLAVVPDSATHQYLVQKARGKRFIWIGLSDRAQEGTFVWSNGVSLGSFHPWRGRNNARADCVAMAKWRRTYVWRVRGCSGKNNYFCQK
ncbi:PREDICTED: fibrillin-3-like [Branchiostoma belcheri]|uniref:Fibrillin-3-like n=1 Tax=Branchiostoma belcheri TaxID=7741 RepID=A0A6P4XHX0_BRABE|nr:PREDICTED: fibrillin-3-like [Branchiostoma belcheri]